jgi:hypothetical protein
MLLLWMRESEGDYDLYIRRWAEEWKGDEAIYHSGRARLPAVPACQHASLPRPCLMSAWSDLTTIMLV